MKLLLVVGLWLLCLPLFAYGDGLLDQGIRAMEQGDFQGAVAIFSQTIGDLPSVSYGNRCLAYLQLGEYERAELDCAEGLKHLPHNPELWLDRGLALYYLQDYDRAIDSFNQGIRLAPHDYRLLYDLGLAYSAKQQPDRSLAEFTKALSLVPPKESYDMAEILIDRGIEFMEIGELPASLGDFRHAIELTPGNSRAWFHQGCAHHRSNQLDLALKDFDRVLALEPRNPEAYKARALVQQQRGETSLALEDLDRASDYFWADQNFEAYAALQNLKGKWQTKRLTQVSLGLGAA